MFHGNGTEGPFGYKLHEDFLRAEEGHNLMCHP